MMKRLASREPPRQSALIQPWLWWSALKATPTAATATIGAARRRDARSRRPKGTDASPDTTSQAASTTGSAAAEVFDSVARRNAPPAAQPRRREPVRPARR